MKYSIGDVVRFKLESGEVMEGDVQFIERSVEENILYINGFSRWAYKVPEKKVVSRVHVKNYTNKRLENTIMREKNR